MIAAVQNTMNNIGGIVAQGVNLGGISQANAPAQTFNTGGFQPGPNINELNDNRSVVMDIKSAFDMDNMKRQVGLALADSGMDAIGL